MISKYFFLLPANAQAELDVFPAGISSTWFLKVKIISEIK
jgi:hypothetical protein